MRSSVSRVAWPLTIALYLGVTAASLGAGAVEPGIETDADRVIWVMLASPAWDVGVRRGDTVVPGQPYVIEMTAGNRVILDPTERPRVDRPLQLAVSAIGALFLAVGLTAATRGRDRRVIFPLVAFCVAAAFSLALLRLSSAFNPWALRFHSPIVLIGSFAFLAFAHQSSGVRVRGFSAGQVSVTIAAAASAMWIAAFTVAHGALVELFPIVRLWVLVQIAGSLAAGLVMLSAQMLRPADAARREISRLLLVSSAAGLVPIVLLSFVPLPFLGRYIVRPDFAVLPSALIPLAIGYGFLRYELWGVRGILRRGLIYLATGVVLGSLYALALDTFVIRSGLSGPAGSTVAVLVAAGAAFPVGWWYLTRWTDRFVYTDVYDYRRALLRLTNAISQSQSVEELRTSVLQPLGGLLNTPAPMLVTDDGHTVPAEGRHVAPARSRGLARLLALVRGDFEQLHPAVFTADDGALVVPLQMGDERIGDLRVSPKRSGEPFSFDDLRLLRTLAVPLGTSVANARLVNELTAKVEELKSSNREIELSRGQLRHLTREVMTAEENERRRLAREIHDASLAEVLALQRMVAELPTSAAERSPLLDMAQRAARELRDACAALRPPQLDDLGLWPALEWLASDVRQRTGHDVDLDPDNVPATLTSEVETALYRIAQEAINNAVRHAGCRRIELRAARMGEMLELVITDDGRGIDAGEIEATQRRSGQFGVLGMRERAAQVGGTVEFENRPARGLRVQVTVPCHGA